MHSATLCNSYTETVAQFNLNDIQTSAIHHSNWFLDVSILVTMHNVCALVRYGNATLAIAVFALGVEVNI